MKPWYLYILECEGGRLYVGVTVDVEARFAAHTAGRGAKFNSALAKGAGASVHNPFLVKALLRYSGVALNQAYGIAIPPGLAPTAADLQYVRISR